MEKEFQKYALSAGISSLAMHRYRSVVDDYISPTIIEERQLNVAQMDVFSRLMMDRILFLGCPIYDDAANIIQAQLLFLESADQQSDIQIYINSPGGSVTAGLGIYDTMQLVSCDVATICTGMAASMGAFLLSSGAKGKRFALPNSEIMIHQPLVSGGGIQGQVTDIRLRSEWLQRTKDKMNRLLAENTGKSLEQVQQDTERDNFMTAEEALAYGLVDKIIAHHE